MEKRIELPESSGGLEAFAMIMDINGFALLVNSYDVESIAKFTCDVLIGGIMCVEKEGGEVVGLMGDAFYALLPDIDSVFNCCFGIAKDVNDQSEYFDNVSSDREYSEFPERIGVKITVEYGFLDVDEIESRVLGKQRLFIGTPVIYAHRISRAGKGNRCLLGPVAGRMLKKRYGNIWGPYKIKGKKGEPSYTYYRFDLSSAWIEGDEPEGDCWYI